VISATPPKILTFVSGGKDLNEGLTYGAWLLRLELLVFTAMAPERDCRGGQEVGQLTIVVLYLHHLDVK
jgi:hypothetical protein